MSSASSPFLVFVHSEGCTSEFCCETLGSVKDEVHDCSSGFGIFVSHPPALNIKSGIFEHGSHLGMIEMADRGPNKERYSAGPHTHQQ